MPRINQQMTTEEARAEEARARRAEDPAGEMRRRAEEEVARADGRADRGAMGSLEKRQHREAAAFSLELFRGIAASPAFKLGRELDAQELAALVTDALEGEPIPKSLRAEAREIVGTIGTMRAGGNRQEADEYARVKAQEFATKLSRTVWKREGEADTFDPRAIAAKVDRSRI